MQVQLIFLMILGGPLSGFRYISENLTANGNTRKAKQFAFLAVFGALLNYFLLMILWDRLPGFKPLINQNLFLGLVLGYSFLLILHIFWTILFALWKKIFNKPKFILNRSTGLVLKHTLIGLLVAVLFFIFGPFRFTFFTILILPHFYIHHRFKMISTRKSVSKIIGWILVFLVVSFPFGQYLNNEWNNDASRFLVRLGYYYLPFVLYALLTLIVFDFLYLFLRIVPKFPGLSFRSLLFHRVTLTLIVLISFGIMVWGSMNFNTPQYTAYELTMKKKSGSLDSLRIAVASDLHLAEISNTLFVEELVQKMNATKADLMLFPGDIMETGRKSEKMTLFVDMLNQLTATYGVYSSTGNHEYYGEFEGKTALIKEAGLNLLLDSTLVFEDKFILIGRNDVHDFNRKPLDSLIPANLNLPVFVMDHRALSLELVSDYAIDLQVSGHTHNGQLFPFQWITRSMYELSWGHKKVGDTHFIVSAGAQGWGPQVRTTAYSEIVVIDVLFN